MGVEVGDTIAALKLMGPRMDHAVFQTVADGLGVLQASAMEKAPVGVTGNSTNAPGDLRRSIVVEGPVGGDGIYSGKVGPTVIYGRQRELGGDIYPVHARALVFTKFGTVYTVQHVYQKPEPFLKPAYDEHLEDLEALAYEHGLAAIEG